MNKTDLMNQINPRPSRRPASLARLSCWAPLVEIAPSVCHNQLDMSVSLWTLGHSTRPIDEFIGLLRAHQISHLVDVRTVPRSRYNPQFNRDMLAQSLRDAGLRYRHLAELGGLRKPKKDSLNDGWRNASFRGYADYMQTDEFLKALEELMAESRLQPTAIMCAEAVPWRCHRSLIADALVSRDWDIRHVMSPEKATLHVLTSFAHFEKGVLTYPKPTDPSLLF